MVRAGGVLLLGGGAVLAVVQYFLHPTGINDRHRCLLLVIPVGGSTVLVVVTIGTTINASNYATIRR